MSDIYSQIPNTADVDEYEEDSFLKIEDEHYSEPELDVLEQAEAILKARRRAKKLGIPSTKPKKRRIIESLDTDSEEDEVIQNRKKIKSTLA